MAEFVDNPELPEPEVDRLLNTADAMLDPRGFHRDLPSDDCAKAFEFLVRLGLIPVQPFPQNLAGGTEPRLIAKKKSQH